MPKSTKEELAELREILVNLSNDQKNKFQTVFEKIDKVTGEVGELKKSIEFTQEQVADLQDSDTVNKEEIEKLKVENETLKESLEKTNKVVDSMKAKINHMDNYSRKYNLKLSGLPMAEGEKNEECQALVREFLGETMEIATNNEILFVAVHRLASKHDGHPDIIMRFVKLTDRDIVWAAKTKLKGSRYYLREEYSFETEQARRILFPYLKAAFSQRRRAKLVEDKLVIDGITYSVDNLPPYTPVHTVRTQDYIFFHGKHSAFSNFFKVDIEINDTKFNCVEQFFQAEFLKHHGLHQSAEKLMNIDDPAQQKQEAKRVMRGRAIKDTWPEASLTVMETALAAKFDRNKHPDLVQALLENEEQMYVEANAWDNYFGIGLGINSRDKTDPQKWKGDNQLGRLITRIRDNLLEQE